MAAEKNEPLEGIEMADENTNDPLRKSFEVGGKDAKLDALTICMKVIKELPDEDQARIIRTLAEFFAVR